MYNLYRNCLLVIIGFLIQIDYSECRAVNISNTWTLPQDGYKVFYRYFRDKISWFEADAVCQFHHANLAIIENIQQFDATRDFLKELDVTGSVWIGLMRPSNADKFAWPTSKQLQTDGYWAESIPTVDAPLCAVLDPSRDFRWHALRCGGPETSAFLCEFEIPEWARECVEKNIPDVTIQYFSDSGAVVLSKECGTLTKEITCQGRWNEETMYDDLKCDTESESETPTESSVNQPSVIIMKDPQKMLDDLFENYEKHNEDSEIQISLNRIESLPEKFSDRKFDFEEIMQGDQPVEMEEDTKKELKKTLKQAEKKLNFNKKTADKKIEKQKKSVSDDDIMLGDQPMIEGQIENASTDTTTTTTLASTTDRQRRETNGSENASTVATEVEETSSNDVNVGGSTLVDSSISTSTEKATELPTTPTTTVEETTTKHMAAGFPIHMSQAVFKDPPVLFDQLNTTHSPRKDLSANDDHFIPPMLLVKARFTPTKPHIEETTFEIGSTDSTKEITTELNADTSPSVDESDVSSVFTEANVENVSTVPITTEKPIMIEKRHDGTIIKREPEITTVTSTAASVVTEKEIVTSEATSPSVQTEEIPTTLSTTIAPETTKQTEQTTEAATTITSTEKIEELTSTTLLPESIIEVEISTVGSIVREDKATDAPTVLATEKTMEKQIEQMTNSAANVESHEIDGSHEHDYDSKENKFSNADYEPFKPNRRRVLTKSDHHNNPGLYIKKILG